MNKLISGCLRLPKLAKDKQDIPERAYYEPRGESRTATSESSDDSEKFLASKSSQRRNAMTNDSEFFTFVQKQKAKENEQLAKDKQYIPERAYYEPRGESRTATSNSPAAARPDHSKTTKTSKLMKQKALKIELPEQGPTLDPDPFVGIPEVFGIQENDLDRFRSFLEAKDATMVFFYCPEGPRNIDAKLHFQKAARTTNRQNHAYAAVNCRQLPDICIAEAIQSLPSFKLYSRGQPMGYYDDFNGGPTTAAGLKRYMEKSPVAKLPRKACALH